jgi:hypothetical protein
VKVFNRDSSKKRNAEDPAPPPELRRTNPINPMQVIRGFKEWLPKIQRAMEWSDPILPEGFEQYGASVEAVCTEASLSQSELRIFQIHREQQLSYAKSRKKIGEGIFTGKGLIVEDARKITEAKKK